MTTVVSSPRSVVKRTGAVVGFDSDKITLADEERQPCEVWTRVMGYHRPLASFNKGKQGEFAERRYFVEPVPGDGG